MTRSPLLPRCALAGRAALLLLAALPFLARPTAAQVRLSNEINQAIDRGIQRLLSWQNADGSFAGAGHASKYPMGQTALAAYTLLKSGIRREDPAIQSAFRYLRGRPLEKTYSVSCWILALDASRAPDAGPEIQRAAAWLESRFNDRDDLWAYPEGEGELSCTQFAVLALWTAERHGYKADPRLWADLIQGTLAIQNKNGGFGYRPSDRPFSQGSMTTAGITTLEIALLMLSETGKFAKVTRAGESSLERAWEWMDRHFTATGNPARDNSILANRHKVQGGGLYMFHYYFLWGVERIAAIGERKRIGGRDWYEDGAIQLLREEEPEGGWAYTDTTAFALLFLRRATYSGIEGREQVASIPRAIPWRYSTEDPGSGWQATDFNDSGWRTGAGSFGNFQTGYRQDRTVWNTSDIWLRRRFDWRREPEELRLLSMHDDGLEIYLNGVLAAEAATWSQKPKEYAIAPAALETLRAEGNVIAVHAKNTGGGQTVDVQLTDRGNLAARLGTTLDGKEERAWMQTKPAADVPFVQRWLALGPWVDKEHESFPDEPLAESKAAPKAGARTRGLSWREVTAAGPMLDFAAELKEAERCFYYAFTYLIAEEPIDAALWLGADDGMAVWLDGERVLAHNARHKAVVDEIPVPLTLEAGAHRLLIRVQNWQGPTGLYARVSDRRGLTPRGLRPALSEREPDWAAAAAAQPGYFNLSELAELLPVDTRKAFDFKSESHVEALAFQGTAAGYPRWLAGGSKRKQAASGPAPNPGHKGLLALKAASEERPARLFWRTVLPEGAAQLTAQLSGVVNAEGGTAARVGLQVLVDGELRSFGETVVPVSAKPDKKAWREWAVDLTSVAGKEVLLALEARGGALFVDELRVGVKR